MEKTLASRSWEDGQRKYIQLLARNLARILSRTATARLCALAPGPERDRLVAAFADLFRL